VSHSFGFDDSFFLSSATAFPGIATCFAKWSTAASELKAEKSIGNQIEKKERKKKKKNQTTIMK